MKKYIFILLISFMGQAQVVFETSLATAFEKAKTQNKLVFVEYYNSDCSVCKKLGDLLKKDTLVRNFYNKYFINYALDTKNDSLSVDERNLMEQANLHFEHVPVLLFFDQNKNFVHHSGVLVNADHVINEGKKAMHPDYKTSGLKAKYDKGDRTVRTLYAYCDLLHVQKKDSLLKAISNDLFQAFPKEELPTQKSYTILKQVINSAENGFFEYWINHLDQLKGFETGTKAGTEKTALEKIILKEVTQPNVKNWATEKKEKYKKYIKLLKITDKPEVYFE